MTVHRATLFSEEIRNQIDGLIAKYPDDWVQSAVIPALHLLQKDNGGYLTTEIMDKLAVYLDMPAIAVYEVATFYSMFELEPVGKHKICLCTNVSCMLNGSDEIYHFIKEKIGVDAVGQVSKDGNYSIKKVECLGACAGAPMMQIDNTYYENLTLESVDSIIKELD